MYYSLSYAVSSFDPRMDSASQMFFDELDRRFVPTGAQFDVTQWMKSLSYDTMGLMTFSRPYGYVQHGRDLHGIMDDVRGKRGTRHNESTLARAISCSGWV